MAITAIVEILNCVKDKHMEKDKTINDLMNWLQKRLKYKTVHWEGNDADPYTIAIAALNDPGRVAYISTSNKSPGFYDLALQIVTKPDEKPCVKRCESLDRDALLGKVAEHFFP